MNKHTLSINHKTVSLYLTQPEQPLLLTFLTVAESDELAELLHNKATLLAIDEPLWEHAFTPWAAPAVFKKAPDFSGGADDYLHWLSDTVLPQVKQQFALTPDWSGLLGYSLGGLFAAYAAYQNTPFSRIASVSGSLWFDNWLTFSQSHTMPKRPEKAYFSVGDKEKNTKNPRMAEVENATVATQQYWQSLNIPCVFELNRGNHFEQVAQRLAKAADYLLAHSELDLK